MSEKKDKQNGKSQETGDLTPLDDLKIVPPIISRRRLNSQESDFHIIRNLDKLDNSTLRHSSSKRTKLTREELLAGASAIDATELDPRFKSPDDFLLRTAPKKNFAPEPIDIFKKNPAPDQEPPSMPRVAPAPMIISNEPQHFAMPDLSTLRKELEKEREENPQAGFHEEIPPIERNGSIQIAPSSFSSDFGMAQFHHAQPKEIRSEKPDIGERMRKYETDIREWKAYATNVKEWQTQVMGVMSKLKSELKRTREVEKENETLKEKISQKDYEIKLMSRKSKVRLIDWMKNLGRVSP